MDRTDIEGNDPVLESAEAIGLEGENAEHDNLLDIISQMETRLEALRESENQRDRLQDEIRLQFDDLDARERFLRQREAALDGEADSVQQGRAALDGERSKIHAALDEVANERDTLRTREIEVQVLSETLRRDRELLEGRRSQLEAMERELRGREQVLVTQTELIDQEAGQLKNKKEQLDQMEVTVRERETQARIAEERQKERERALDEREKQVSAAQERFQAMQSEVISLNRRVSDANALAAEHARKAEQTKAEGSRALDEARQHIEKIEAEAQRVRQEVAKLRRSAPTGGEAPDLLAAPSARRRPKVRSARSKSISLAVLWLVAMGVTGLACYFGIMLSQPLVAAGLLGIAFAGAFVGALASSTRALDPASLPVILLGGTFGWWFPRFYEMISSALATWDLPLESLPAEILPQLPMAIALLASGMVLALCLAFLGGSIGLMVQSFMATLAATALSLLPDPSSTALAAGALIWHAIMAASLGRWAMQGVSENVMEALGPPRMRGLA
ncbi:MAG: hypothetical protein R3B68_16805 [Phycisphaerales bacterium]